MTDSTKFYHVLCLTGGRNLNKRMVLFIEGIVARGDGVQVLSLPRGRWRLDKSENALTPQTTGWVTLSLSRHRTSRLSAIMCFHWLMLPVAVLAGLLFGAPVLYDEHDHYELNTLEASRSRARQVFFGTLVKWIHRLCLPWVTVVTCIHMYQNVLRKHLERWQPSIIELHNYPSHVWRHRCTAGSSEPRISFVYIGGVFAEKGPEVAAEAVLKLTDEAQSRIELHIFGDGDEALIARLRLMPRVFMHNAVKPEQFREFASTRRCCGLSLLADTPRYRLVGTNCTKLYEYLALGMPVIATRVGEFPQFIEASDVGLLVNGTLNAGELASAMSTLLSNHVLFERMSKNASQLMNREEMSWEHEWQKVESFGILDARKKAA